MTVRLAKVAFSLLFVAVLSFTPGASAQHSLSFVELANEGGIDFFDGLILRGHVAGEMVNIRPFGCGLDLSCIQQGGIG